LKIFSSAGGETVAMHGRMRFTRLVSEERFLHNTPEDDVLYGNFTLQWWQHLLLRLPISKLSGITMPNLSRKVPPAECDLQLSRLQLVSWPFRIDLFQEDSQHIIRICALLARRPSVGILLPVLLDLSPNVTYSLLQVLHAQGHIGPVGGVVMTEQAALPEAESVQDCPLPTPMASFLNKVWQHLTEKSTFWGSEGHSSGKLG
jgi:hypothetical protein